MKNRLTEVLRLRILHDAPSPESNVLVAFDSTNDHPTQILTDHHTYRAEATLHYEMVDKAGAEDRVKREAVKQMSTLIYRDVIEELRKLRYDIRAVKHGDVRRIRNIEDRVNDLRKELEGQCS